VAFPCRLLGVADVIIMHGVPMSLLCLAWKGQSDLCAVLNVSLGCLWFAQLTDNKPKALFQNSAFFYLTVYCRSEILKCEARFNF